MQISAPPPQFAIYVMVVATPLVVAPWTFDQVVLPRLGVTAVLTGVGLASAGSAAVVAAVPRRIFAAAALLVSLVMLSTLLSDHPTAAIIGEFQRYQGLLPLTVYVALMLVTAMATSSRTSSSNLAWCFVGGGSLAATYALLDHFDLDPLRWSIEVAGRAGGPFGQPNVLGLHLAVCLILAIALALSDRPTKQRSVVGASAALMGVALLLTQSRGAVVAATVGMLFLLWLLRTRLTKLRILKGALLAVLLVVVLALAPAGTRPTFSILERGAQGVDEERLGLWATAVDMWIDRPLFGSGPDSFSIRFPEYRTPDQPGIQTENARPESAHNLFMDLLVGTGALGLLAFVGLVSLVVVPVIKQPAQGLNPAAAGLTAALITYFVAASFSFGEAMTGWIPWVLLGALIQDGSQSPVKSAVGRWQRPVLLAAALGAMVGGGLLFLADWRAGQSDLDDPTGSSMAGLRTAVALNPLLVNYRYRLAETEYAAGRFGQAAETYRAANQAFGPNAYSLLAEARALMSEDSQRHSDAIEALLTQTERLDPHNSPAADAIQALRSELKRENPAQRDRGAGVPPP